MYRAKVNNHFNFDIDSNNRPKGWDIISPKEGEFHLIQDHQSYDIEVLDVNLSSKSVVIGVNGQSYEVVLQDKMDLLLEKMGISTVTAQKVNDVKAPMPGLVLEIKVEAGGRVEKGDALFVLEAMKMENVLKSPGEGIVESIEVKVGNAVEKNQVLLKME